MTLGQNQEKFTQDLARLLNYLIDNGYAVRIGEVERTQAQQEIYIKEGKSKTYNSMHLKMCRRFAYIQKRRVATIKNTITKHWRLLGKLRSKQ